MSEPQKQNNVHPNQEQNGNGYSLIDESLLQTIEDSARHNANSLSAIVQHLQSKLQSLSSLSVQYMKLHKKSVDNLNEEIYNSIVSIQILISKCQQLNIELKKVEPLYRDIKIARKYLDQLEKQVNKALKPK